MSQKEHSLAELVKCPFFLAALHLASNSLYQVLEKHAFELEALPPKAVTALNKYLNRMRYRPTPFGLFSGFGVANWKADPEERLQLDSTHLKVHAMPSYSRVLDLAQQLFTEAPALFQTYRANGSLYKVGKEYRFLRFDEDREKGGRSFYVDAVGYESYLHALLQFCKTEKTKQAIIDWLTEVEGVTAADGAVFMDQLVEQQLLVSIGQANITGEDYLLRLWRYCQEHHLDTPTARRIGALLDSLRVVAHTEPAPEVGALLLGQVQAATDLESGRSPLYTNLERKIRAGGVPACLQKDILEGLKCAQRLLLVQQPAGILRFQKAFIEKFDRRSVPLLEALDPELGIGYEDLASSFQMSKLLQDIDFGSTEAAHTTLDWSPAHALLLDKWRSASGSPPVLQLHPEELKRLPETREAAHLPPSTAVLFRVLQDKVYLEQAGGVSATALIGRFTPANQEIVAMAEAIAQREEAANPNVLFAEIAHIGAEHTANIDRRRTIRQFEIPVLVESGVGEAFQITLSDLMVQVEGEEVLLWSKRLQKRVIPRLSSAFNYTRDDLAVFRFLCDLQYQGLQANFTLDLSSFFPDLNFYPRVEYKRVILALASWRLTEAQLKDLFRGTAEEQPALLKKLGKELDWPRHIAITHHDHQLVFDMEKEEDIAFLLENLRDKLTVLIREFPFVGNQSPMVSDKNRQPYVNQFLTALYHTQEVYKGVSLPVFRQAGTPVRRHAPGSEWLYFKLYCHPTQANQVLATCLHPVLERLVRKGEVRQWFYIRYQDPAYHLRLRLRASKGQAAALFQKISKVLDGLLRQGTVQDVQLAVYERELERYGSACIDTVEQVFCASSGLIAHFLQETGLEESDSAYYRFAFKSLDVLLDASGLSLTERIDLLESLYLGFYQEHDGTKALRQQLSRKFREISQEADLLPAVGKDLDLRGDGKRQVLFVESLRSLAAKAQTLPTERKRGLLADLMHMHLNRLLVDQARKQELVIYYCLWRHYQSQRAQGIV